MNKITTEEQLRAIVGDKSILLLCSATGVTTSALGDPGPQTTEQFADMDPLEAEAVRSILAVLFLRHAGVATTADKDARAKILSDELALAEAAGADPQKVTALKETYLLAGLDIDRVRQRERDAEAAAVVVEAVVEP